MYRMNAQSRAIEESFLRYGIRYQLVGGTRFYARREVKDALAYLRVLRSDTDSVSFERIINVPPRGHRRQDHRGPASRPRPRGRLDVGRDRGGRTRASWRPSPRDRRSALADFAVLVRRLRATGRRPGRSPSCSTRPSRRRATGRCWPTARRTARSAGRTSSSCAPSRPATTTSTPDDALDRLLEETALVADQDSYEGDADAVTLITLHAAKGLEFPVVFIAGLEEGLFPHSRALDDEKELEEERRLAYVGITRAKRRLYLSHAWRRATWGMGQAVGPVAVPARDPGRADGRAAARWRATSATSTSTSSSAPAGRAGSTRRSGPAGPRAYRQGSGRPGAPAAGEPFRPSRDLAAKREAYADGAHRSLAARSSPGTTTSTRRRPRAPGPGRAPVIPGRAAVPRRRPRATRPLGRRHRRDLQADPQRRGGHGRLQGPGRRSEADAGEPRQPRDHRVTEVASRLAGVVTLADFEPLARAAMDPAAFDYVAGGSWDEDSLAENDAAWRRRRFRPRVLVDVSRVEPATTLLGAPARSRWRSRRWPSTGSPIPTARSRPSAPRPRPACRSRSPRRPRVPSRRSPRPLRTPFAGSSSTSRLTPRVTRSLVERAEAAGYRAIVLTVDLPVLGYRERDRRSGFELPPLGNFVEDGATHGNHAPEGFDDLERHIEAGLTWDDLATIGGWSSLPLVVKGILTAEDARLAVEHGARRDRRQQPRRAPARSCPGHGRRPRGGRRGGRRSRGGVGRRRRPPRTRHRDRARPRRSWRARRPSGLVGAGGGRPGRRRARSRHPARGVRDHDGPARRIAAVATSGRSTWSRRPPTTAKRLRSATGPTPAQHSTRPRSVGQGEGRAIGHATATIPAVPPDRPL